MILLSNNIIILLACALILSFLYLGFDGIMFKKFGSNMSTYRGILMDKGFDSAFAVVGGFIYPLSVLICFIFCHLIGICENLALKPLAIATAIIYFAFVIGLNIWGKRFLISRGIEPVSKDGYKGFVQIYKEELEKAKEKQRKKKEDSLFD